MHTPHSLRALRLPTRATIVLALFTATICQAAVPTLDTFTGEAIDASRWQSAETVRNVATQRRALLGHWSFGSTSSDSGVTTEERAMRATDTATAKTLQATLSLEHLSWLNGCPANPNPSTSQLRLAGAFFNSLASGGVSGDPTGDVIAQVALQANSDTPGQARAVGSVLRCDDASCASPTVLGSVDLGSASLSQSVVMTLSWDKANKQFTFTRDGQTAASQSVAYGSLVRRYGEPALGLNLIGVRNQVANCSAGRVKAGSSGYVSKLSIVH